MKSSRNIAIAGTGFAGLAAMRALGIADGANSQLRAQTGLHAKNAIYPWGAVWAVLPDPARHYGATLWQWYRQANQMLGIMPASLQPGGDRRCSPRNQPATGPGYQPGFAGCRGTGAVPDPTNTGTRSAGRWCKA